MIIRQALDNSIEWNPDGFHGFVILDNSYRRYKPGTKSIFDDGYSKKQLLQERINEFLPFTYNDEVTEWYYLC